MTEYESYVQEMPDIQIQLNAPNAPVMRGYDSTNLKGSQVCSNKSCLGGVLQINHRRTNSGDPALSEPTIESQLEIPRSL